MSGVPRVCTVSSVEVICSFLLSQHFSDSVPLLSFVLYQCRLVLSRNVMGNQKHPVFLGEQTSALCVSGVFVAPLLPSQMESVGYLTLILKETEGTPPK